MYISSENKQKTFKVPEFAGAIVSELYTTNDILDCLHHQKNKNRSNDDTLSRKCC